jgi:hypothetical protein
VKVRITPDYFGIFLVKAGIFEGKMERAFGFYHRKCLMINEQSRDEGVSLLFVPFREADI